jgi:CheY-like chemotaxis protein
MKRILFADDNEAFRALLAKLLESAGYEVLTAADGAAAVGLFRQQPADLAIIDLLMPGKEGLETIRELRRIQPGLKIIAISGGGFGAAGDYLEIARLLGAVKTLTKPFALTDALEIVKNLLEAAPETA